MQELSTAAYLLFTIIGGDVIYLGHFNSLQWCQRFGDQQYKQLWHREWDFESEETVPRDGEPVWQERSGMSFCVRSKVAPATSQQ